MACWPAKGSKLTALAAQGFLLRIQARTLFEKVLSKSDARAGRIVIPKIYAEAFLPRLDSQAGVRLSLVDVWGTQHHVQYTFWNCTHRDDTEQKRMFVMAASSVLDAYGLEAGDVIVFAIMPDGTLLACGREANGLEMPVPRSAAAVRALSSSTQQQQQQQQQGQSFYSAMAGAATPQHHQVSRKRPADSTAERPVSRAGPPVPSMLLPQWTHGMLPPQQAGSMQQPQLHSMPLPEQPAITVSELKKMRLEQEAPLSVQLPAQQSQEEGQQLWQGDEEVQQQQQPAPRMPLMVELPPLRPRPSAQDLPVEESSRLYSQTEQLPQLIDGVFRAAPASSSLPLNQVSCITILPGSCCVCYAAVVTLGGEKYQAFYDNRKAAEFDLEAVLQSQPPTGAEATGMGAACGSKPFTRAQASLSKLRTQPQQQSQQGAAAGRSSVAALHSGRSSAAGSAVPHGEAYAAAESDSSPVAATPPRAAAVRAAAHAAAALTLIATSPPMPALRLRSRPSRRKPQPRLRRPSSAAANAASSPAAAAPCRSKAAASAATSPPQEIEELSVSSPRSNELEALNEAYFSAIAAAAAGAAAPAGAGAAAAAAAAGSATLGGSPQPSLAPAPSPPTDAAPYRLMPPVLPTPLPSATRPSSAAELGGAAQLGNQTSFVMEPAPTRARGRWIRWNKTSKTRLKHKSSLPLPLPPPAASLGVQQPSISPAAGLVTPLPGRAVAAAAPAVAVPATAVPAAAAPAVALPAAAMPAAAVLAAPVPAAAAAAIGLPMTPASLHLLLSFMRSMGVSAAQAHSVMAAAAQQEKRWQEELFGGQALGPSSVPAS